MKNSCLENYNLELIDSIPLTLKRPLKELITLMENEPLLYGKDDIIKLLEDLKSKRLVIKIEKVITSQNNVGNSLDRLAFGYGHVDFCKECFLYNQKKEKRIILWEEIMRIR